jgi:hypothetical protein
MTAKIKLNAASGGGSVSLQAPTSTTGNANIELKLPVADASGFLKSDGSGNLSNSLSTSGTDNFTIADGNLVIGTDGHGIDFSASSGSGDSELLDDYEEGTFNPTMANSVTLQSGSDTLSYVKVGHLVIVTGVVRINSGNSSSDFSITNMPFATVNSAESSGNAIGSASIYDNNMNSGYTQVISVMNPNSTQLNVVVQKESGAQGVGLDSTDNGYIGVSITYRSA